MASMRDIKRRRTSISSTQQITKAMKLVSTVKLQRAKQRVNIVTYEGYETEVRRYVLPYFKDHPLKLTDLNRRKMQNFFDYLIKTGRKDGRQGPFEAGLCAPV